MIALLFSTLTVGVGLTAGAYSVVNALLWKALPIKDYEGLVLIETALKDGRTENIFPHPLFRYLRESGPRGMDVAGRSAAQFNLQESEGDVQPIAGELVTGGYFAVLGVRPRLGRFIDPSDDDPRDPKAVCVLSHQLWKRRFAGSEGSLGQTITLNGNKLTVIGIAPENFFGVQRVYSPDVFVPSAMQPRLSALKTDMLNDAGARWMQLLARRSGAVPPGELRAATDMAVRQFVAERGVSPADYGAVQLRSGSRGFPGAAMRFESPLLTLAAVLAVLLLVAVINLANIFVAAGLEKRKEIATRLSLGAKPARLAADLLIEIGTLTLAGAAGGAALSFWIAPALLTLLRPITGPVQADLAADWNLVGLIGAASLAIAVLLAAGPALGLRDLDIAASLRSLAEPARRRFGHRSLLAAAQIACSFLLLVSASLLVRTLNRLTRVETGFTSDAMLLVTFNPALDRYSPAEARNAIDSVSARVRGLPFVRGEAWARNVPFSGNVSSRSVFAEASTVASTLGMNASANAVSPNYFSAMGVPIVKGRDFEQGESLQAPRVAIVNEALAARLWPDRDPVGQRFGWGSSPAARSQVTVVGVVRNLIDQPRKPAAPAVYTPLAQERVGEVVLHMRLNQPNPQLIAAVRRFARESNPPLTPYRSRWLGDQVRQSVALERIVASIAGVCGAVAWLLACFGIYGLMSYIVARRTREFSLRLALGAEPRRIASLVLAQGGAVVCCGIIAGLLCSMTSAKLIRSMLFGVSASDQLSYWAAVALIAGAVAVGCCLPIRNAIRSDPAIVLRGE